MPILGLVASAVFLGGTPSPHLAALAGRIAEAAVSKFGPSGLKREQLGISIATLDREAKSYSTGSFRGEVDMYPASVVKLFYLAYLAHLVEKREVTLTPELQRAATDTIVDSVNDATALVVDTITHTTGGPELPPKELAQWMEKRQAVNRWFASLGYPKLNACQKPWNEGPYGREHQGYGAEMKLRNSLSPDVCVRLMVEIALDKVVSPEKCAWMRSLLSRSIPADAPDAGEQARLFSGKSLPSGAKLWSKAGWTNSVRHDVAYVQLPDGREVVFALFTRGASEDTELIPFMAGELLRGLSEQGLK